MKTTDLSDYSFPVWLMKNHVVTEKSLPFEFVRHHFLFDIARDFAPEQVIKKCGQVGVSLLMNLKAFFVAQKMRASIIYTMPSDSDVEEFSKTKTDPVFRSNEIIRRALGLDNVGLKQVGDRFIHFKGTRSKTAPISTSADVLIHDEVDRSDLTIVEGYQSRITASDMRWTWKLSNPSQYKTGVDVDWEDSDKKEWFVECRACRYSQPLVWEENVDEVGKMYVCAKCKAPLSARDIMLGHWEPTGSGSVSGYHISQMMAPWITPAELIKAKNKRGIEYFRNFVLGEPYSPGDVADFARVILDSWTAEPLDEGDLYMGVDVGRVKHWALGNRDGIFKIGTCTRREELEEVIVKYAPKVVVMDSGPERTWAEEFRNKFPNLWICFYHRDRETAEMLTWGGLGENKTTKEFSKLGYVWIDRNRVIDDLVYNMQRGEVQYHLTRELVEMLIEHWQTMRRLESTNTLGQKRYQWSSTTGVNHFASAMWFYWVARMTRGDDAKFVPEPSPSDRKLIETNAKGEPVMRDLKEIMEEQKDL